MVKFSVIHKWLISYNRLIIDSCHQLSVTMRNSSRSWAVTSKTSKNKSKKDGHKAASNRSENTGLKKGGKKNAQIDYSCKLSHYVYHMWLYKMMFNYSNFKFQL